MSKKLEDLIGQQSVKRHLNFMLRGFNATGRIPTLLFSAPKGTGKTEFAKRFSAKLKTTDGKTRPFIEINCGSLRRARDFFDIVYPHKIADRSVNVLFDECHAMPKDLQVPFLTLFAVNDANTATIDTEDGGAVVFDFKRQSYIFATTESDKIFGPLKNRLDEISFDFYSDEDMQNMLNLYVNAQISDAVMPHMVHAVRHVARNVVKLAQKVNMYAAFSKIARIEPMHWADLSKQIGLLPHGITQTEFFVLNLLKERGEQSLQAVCASTGLSRTALMYDVENGLMKLGFMDKGQNSKRLITAKGIGALAEAARIKEAWA